MNERVTIFIPPPGAEPAREPRKKRGPWSPAPGEEYDREADLTQATLLAFAEDVRVRVWRNNTGAVKVRGRTIRFSVPGASDVLGLLWTGRLLAIENKSPTGRLSKEQRAFRDMVTWLGGLYVVGRSVQQIQAEVDAALAGSPVPEAPPPWWPEAKRWPPPMLLHGPA